LFPALRGKAEVSAQGPDLFIPTILAVSTREDAVLQQMSFTDRTKIGAIVNQYFFTPHRGGHEYFCFTYTHPVSSTRVKVMELL
jgi:hypothetical protein